MKKYFWGSFCITIIIAVFVAGMITVDFRCTKTMTGVETEAFTITETGENTNLYIDTLGLKTSVDITYFVNFIEIVAKLICIPF